MIDQRDPTNAASGRRGEGVPGGVDLTVASYASKRSNYGGAAPSSSPVPGGVVAAVRPESPADDAGIEPGMVVESVNGASLVDMIDWLWEADAEAVDLVVYDLRDGSHNACTLERFIEEDWGISFSDAVFDGIRTCVNACVFCFMTMLPPHMRDTLYIRDDDYRLSFLEGNFVTLTNVSDEDACRIIERRLSPMNVSLHAVSPDVRRRLMGRNAQRGLDVLERLLDSGIEVHAQIVVCPGLNDGDELERTLAWCAERPAITSLGIVPMGYTRFSKRFDRSFSDDPALARRVIEQVRPYQDRFRRTRGRTVFQLSDEFYLDARVEVPLAETYDGYPQFYDGIGMVRSFLDDAERALAERAADIEGIKAALDERGARLMVVCGEAIASTIARFAGRLGDGGSVVPIKNEYFGGNVDVTGLICGCDLLEQLPQDLHKVVLILPDVMLNSQGMTLDGYHRTEILETLTRRGAAVRFSPSTPDEMLRALAHAVGKELA